MDTRLAQRFKNDIGALLARWMDDPEFSRGHVAAMTFALTSAMADLIAWSVESGADPETPELICGVLRRMVTIRIVTDDANPPTVN
jgi:hypothetical protein